MPRLYDRSAARRNTREFSRLTTIKESRENTLASGKPISGAGVRFRRRPRGKPIT
jgi:hypothetical protein